MEWKKREREKIGNKNLELKFFIFYELKMITIFVKKSHVVKNDVHRRDGINLHKSEKVAKSRFHDNKRTRFYNNNSRAFYAFTRNLNVQKYITRNVNIICKIMQNIQSIHCNISRTKQIFICVIFISLVFIRKNIKIYMNIQFYICDL